MNDFASAHVPIATPDRRTPGRRLPRLPVLCLLSSVLGVVAAAQVEVTATGTGIGTSSPGALLHVSKTGVSGSADMLKLTGAIDGSNLGGSLTVKAIYHPGYGADYDFNVGRWTGGGYTDFSLLNLNATGNVGIGTANPGYALSVHRQVAGGEAIPLYIRNDTTWTQGVRTSIGFGANNTDQIISKISTVYDTSNRSYLSFGSWNNSFQDNLMVVRGDGNVGIGTTSPAYRLHIDGTTGTPSSQPLTVDLGDNGSIAVRGSSSLIYAGFTAYKGATQMWFAGREGDNYVLRTGTGANVLTAEHSGAVAGTLYLKAGNVGIGTTNPGYKLEVAGTVRATSFVSNTTTYADFVFKPGYRLAPLSEVEAHIEAHGHLPGIPSEAEAVAEGIDLAAMQVKLLQKVEEMTLHLIRLEKENTELRREMQRMQAALSE